MVLKNLNPTQTQAWKNLKQHYQQAKNYHLIKLFQKDVKRKERFSVQFDSFELDYSKNLVTEKTLSYLILLAKDFELKYAIERYFAGNNFNITENKAVLHTALRNSTDQSVLANGKNVKPQIANTLNKIKSFSENIISGKWKGYTGKPITDIVNIGIGGSELGPSMVLESLKYYKNKLNTHFISNVDGDHLSEILKKIKAETTLFIIVSKTFTTQETISNAHTLLRQFLKADAYFTPAKHFVAVTANIDAAVEFGIDTKNIFPIWDWVGGRFSLWSAVGLSISLQLGFKNFKQLLNGAEKMDKHFRTADFRYNIPVLLSLLSIWYNNFFKSETEAVFAYSHYLKHLPQYLQQIFMESNGKLIDRNGQKVSYQTASIVWGGVGTNMQHSFMQLLHQGTKLVPADFIGFKESLYGNKDHHNKLMANFYAQFEALAFGKTKEEAHLDLKLDDKFNQMATLLPYKVFPGNKPSNTIIINKLSPETLGMLLSMYEHKVFVQGVLWNIFSFDQFGVELGKELAKKKLQNTKFT
ncbi:MAG: glucose-6-phosphate isomerase [Tenacibaculum sp.]